MCTVLVQSDSTGYLVVMTSTDQYCQYWSVVSAGQ